MLSCALRWTRCLAHLRVRTPKHHEEPVHEQGSAYLDSFARCRSNCICAHEIFVFRWAYILIDRKPFCRMHVIAEPLRMPIDFRYGVNVVKGRSVSVVLCYFYLAADVSVVEETGNSDPLGRQTLINHL